ncbi:MAG: hypothetical protein H0U22_10765 [Geodermatophilaceae bacterium]|nr:hypothetical protein [Geodermatophilaceae bacterium]
MATTQPRPDPREAEQPHSLANFAGAVHGGHTAMVFDEVCCDKVSILARPAPP